jgi:hypothetical protein
LDKLLEIHTIFKAIFILIQDPIVFITNRSGNPMVSGDKLSLAAIIALEMMEEFISVMERAANQIYNGRTLNEIQVEDYQLYMASHEYQRAVVCVWDSDDYFCVLESAASKAGLCLDEAAQLDVQLPEAEFDENMISGGFQV